MCLKVLTVFLAVFVVVHSYKILALFPHPARSHVDVFLPLTKALAKKGHEVTVIGHFPLKEPMANYTDIVLEGPLTTLNSFIHMDDFRGRKIEQYTIIQLLIEFAQISCKAAFESPSLQEFLKTDHEFDVIIAEFFNSDCFLGLVHKLKAPLIGMSSCALMHWTNERFANPTNPSYIPNNLLEYSDQLSFFQRVENLLAGLGHQIVYNEMMLRNDDSIARQYLGEDLPPLRDIFFNTSLMLVNSHFSLNLPRPLVPAVVEVGGIHIDHVNKLPEDLEKWISEAPHGVIYFSLGSMIKGHTFPQEKRLEFLKAFGRLPQRVLWKWENDSMPGKPDNVMIQKWMPQLDILCHPNVKAFISHGGLLGTVEAVHCGVPVVVMPQFGDQHTNARAMETTGGGVVLQLYEATEEKVYNALRTVLEPNFRKGAQELSTRFRDRPLPPLETAIYWVEYVARHRGAHHMRTAAVDMPLYKYLLLDVIAFLLLVIGLSLTVFFFILRAILRRLFSRRDKQKTN